MLTAWPLTASTSPSLTQRVGRTTLCPALPPERSSYRLSWRAASCPSTLESKRWTSEDRNGSMEDSPTVSPSFLSDEPSPCLPSLGYKTCVRSTGGATTLSSDWLT